jgi:formylglycine-generating enzyme required for sulfatase activity
MGKNPSSFKGADHLPVESVSWLDAVEFCNALSAVENRKAFYRINSTEVTLVGGNGYRLPTEAEWEYACRAGSTTLYPFGDDHAMMSNYSWCRDNSEGKTSPVARTQANAWGLHDMLGNVWEWCADGYDENYYVSSPPADPRGAAGAAYRVVRGGSWDSFPWHCRPAYRGGSGPEYWYDYLGFRVVASLE